LAQFVQRIFCRRYDQQLKSRFCLVTIKSEKKMKENCIQTLNFDEVQFEISYPQQEKNTFLPHLGKKLMNEVEKRNVPHRPLTTCGEQRQTIRK